MRNVLRRVGLRKALVLAGLLTAAAVAAVIVVVIAGDGGDEGHGKDPTPEDPRFHTRAGATPYAGAVPLTVKFEAEPFKSTGEVRYRWNFDDGTTSREQNPTHRFGEAGYYEVTMQASDDTHDDGWTVLVGVWPKSVWETSQRPGRRQDLHQVVRDQRRRTEARRQRLRASRARRERQQ